MTSTFTSSIAPSSAFDDFVLKLLRPAYVEAQRAAVAIAEAGIALRAGWIDGEGALGMLAETGLLDFVTGPSSC
jgi:hypothetical protein